MTSGEARRLLAHCAWADRRFVDTAEALGDSLLDRGVESSFGTLRSTLCHIVASEWIWARRWLGESPSAAPPWGATASMAALGRHLAALEAERDGYLAGLNDGDLDRPVEYRSLEGGLRVSRLGDTIHHVLIHAAHHRGQAATQLRQLGVTPPNVAFLEYLRTAAR